MGLTNLPGVSQSAEMKNQEEPSQFQMFTCGLYTCIPVQGWPGGQVGLWGEEQQNHPAGWIHPHTPDAFLGVAENVLLSPSGFSFMPTACHSLCVGCRHPHVGTFIQNHVPRQRADCSTSFFTSPEKDQATGNGQTYVHVEESR